LQAFHDETDPVLFNGHVALLAVCEFMDGPTGAQTVRRGGAGPVGTCLPIRTPPAALSQESELLLGPLPGATVAAVTLFRGELCGPGRAFAVLERVPFDQVDALRRAALVEPFRGKVVVTLGGLVDVHQLPHARLDDDAFVLPGPFVAGDS